MRPKDPELTRLLKRFICVRMIQINDLDLSVMQFDFELTWTAFFLNGDGTLYGRYGTRSENDRKRNTRFDRSAANEARDGMPKDMTLAGFKDSLRAALRFHERFEADETGDIRDSLRGKTGEPWPWPTPKAMPGIRRACTHCHQVGSNLVLHHRQQPTGTPDTVLWSFPMPDALGLVLDPERAATVARVTEGSEAAAAGVRVGDRLRTMGGQPILSAADVQWVLQHATDGRPLRLQVERGTEGADLKISVPEGWPPARQLRLALAFDPRDPLSHPRWRGLALRRRRRRAAPGTRPSTPTRSRSACSATSAGVAASDSSAVT